MDKEKEVKKKTKIRDICILQAVIAVYTLSTVFAKFASGQEFLSFKFILFYGIEILILGVYAIIWQQLIKKFDISVAYANKAMGLLWSIVWAILIFNETITIKNVIGVIIVIAGTIIVNSEDDGTLKANSSWRTTTKKTLLEEALNKDLDSIPSKDITK